MKTAFKTVTAQGAEVSVEITDDGYKIARLPGAYLAVAPGGRDAGSNVKDDSGLYLQLLEAINKV